MSYKVNFCLDLWTYPKLIYPGRPLVSAEL